jgi:hypothetical protein
MSTPQNPLTAQAPPDPTQGLMQQAQQSMQNPMAQAVPQQGGGLSAIVNHPIVKAIVNALATGAQSYGWTGQSPQERLERTQMEQQKAETMARMAQTGAYQEGELQNRRLMAQTGAAREQDYAADVKSKAESRDTQNAIKQQLADLAVQKNEWQKDMSAGRLDAAKQKISNQAAQFEQTFLLRSKQVGIEQAKLELAQTGMGIKQGFLDLANTALSQKGTAEGINTITKLQSLAMEHPILSQVFGLDDVSKAVTESKGAGMPGVSQNPPMQSAPTAAPATNKIDAKRNQKNPPAGGATHIWTPNGIQPIGAPKP